MITNEGHDMYIVGPKGRSQHWGVDDDVVEGYKGYVLNTYILEEIGVSCGDQRGL